MPNAHPAAVAASIAMLDHMLDGRLIFGISPGGLLSDAEAFGNLEADRNAMFLEAINQVLRDLGERAALQSSGPVLEHIGSEDPDRRHRPGLHSTSTATAAPADRGHCGGAVLKGCDGSRRTRLGADLGKLPDAGLGEKPLAEICRGCERAGRPADSANWRVAKSVFVAKDAATAKAYATDPNGPYVYYYRSLFTKLKRGGRIELFKTRRDQPDDEVTLESICDKLIIHGTPESVADQLLAFQEETGPFGTLLYAGKDWKDRELGRQSMILMAEKVMPRVNAGCIQRLQGRRITHPDQESLP